MSSEQRRLLGEQYMRQQPELRSLLKSRDHDLFSGSWAMLAYSFERGFEELWDAAYRSLPDTILLTPLLMLWRQSIELHIKSAISYTSGDPRNIAGHDLKSLFDRLIYLRRKEEYEEEEKLVIYLRGIIKEVQRFDKSADRFRYPRNRNGDPYADTDVDLEQLYQTHWIITGWCQGAEIEVEQRRGIF
ncbi:hypothetical protein ACTVH1_16310 [Gluconobacter cerinus]|uniref:hypothetical protein n=1 Tax=Gluconobacter oxydans TaxID=442 RepID=UPI0039E7B7DE